MRASIFPSTIPAPCARFDLLWNNAIYGPLFTEVCLLYIRANAPTMGPVVSTSRSQLSVIASRKTRRRNFCKWSHSLSTAGALWDGEQSATRLLLASANSLKAMIQPSIPRNGTFKNPICAAERGDSAVERRFSREKEIGAATIVCLPRFAPRCLNMKRHEIYMRDRMKKKSIYYTFPA